MRPQKNKVKIAVIISVVSVLIAIVSLVISIYMNAREIKYKENMEKMQVISQELEKRGLEFDENYKKISLAEKNIMDQMENCKDSIDENSLNKNLKLLINARSALIKENNALASVYLEKIDEENICKGEIYPAENTFFWEIGVVAFIWIVMIATLIKILKLKNR